MQLRVKAVVSPAHQGVQPEPTVYVHVDMTFTPGTIDAELSRGFVITGAVARWAWQDREGFCR